MFGFKKRPTHVFCVVSPPEGSVFAVLDSPLHIRRLDQSEPVPLPDNPSPTPRELNARIDAKQKRGTKAALCGRTTHADFSMRVDFHSLNLSGNCPVCVGRFREQNKEFG